MPRDDLSTLRDRVRDAKPMTPAARERQIVSLAYGNLKLENDRITRAQVADAPDRRPKR